MDHITVQLHDTSEQKAWATANSYFCSLLGSKCHDKKRELPPVLPLGHSKTWNQLSWRRSKGVYGASQESASFTLPPHSPHYRKGLKMCPMSQIFSCVSLSASKHCEGWKFCPPEVNGKFAIWLQTYSRILISCCVPGWAESKNRYKQPAVRGKAISCQVWSEIKHPLTLLGKIVVTEPIQNPAKGCGNVHSQMLETGSEVICMSFG